MKKASYHQACSTSTSTSTSTRKIHLRQLKQMRYHLDILTDGSEVTGHGSIFLTISRSPVQALHQPQSDEKLSSTELSQNTILARYALTGLSTLTSRIAADQAFKLSPIRAVFCPFCDVTATVGIPSLLLALSNYSMTGTLNMIGPSGMEKFTNDIVDLTLGRRKVYPKVLTCDVPQRLREGDGEEEFFYWWAVYEDEFIIVHARMNVDEDKAISEKSNTDQSGAVYIVSLKSDEGFNYSFAVLPPKVNTSISSQILHPLPADITSKISSSSHHNPKPNRDLLDFILHVDPSKDVICEEDASMKIHTNIDKLTKQHLATLPNNTRVDPGILIRAADQSTLLHSQLPFAFPKRKLNPKVIDKGCNRKVDLFSRVEEICVKYQKLDSCATVILNNNNNNDRPSSFQHICRRKEIMDKISMKTSYEKRPNLQELKKLYSKWQNGVPTNLKEEAVVVNEDLDENEIDLSDDEESEEESSVENVESQSPSMKRMKTGYEDALHDENECDSNLSRPTLLVLGTGCASPSPTRGSSGYALLLPTMFQERDTGKWKKEVSLSAIIECGEGTLLTLLRHLPNTNRKLLHEQSDKSHLSFLSNIKLIWISHAHLDHYGELPLLVNEIYKNMSKGQICTCYNAGCKNRSEHKLDSMDDNSSQSAPKCKTCGLSLPPLVVAPPKVLRFLDVSLKCKHGISRDGRLRERLFFGVTNSDFDFSPFSRQLRDDMFGYELQRQPDNGYIVSNQHSPQTYQPFIFFKSVPVEHCPNAHALILGLRLPNNNVDIKVGTNCIDSFFYLCYSGDTRPSANIVRTCQYLFESRHELAHDRGSISLLLHEATFDDDEKGLSEAISKKHSTVQEAIQTGDKISAEVCLLTHFSQRYPKLPPGYISLSHDTDQTKSSTGDLKKPLPQNVAFAFDGMMIPIDKSILPRLLPMLCHEAIRVLESESQ
jgi:ribonuclease BN (tRNA processing enzyme)